MREFVGTRTVVRERRGRPILSGGRLLEMVVWQLCA